MADDLMSTSVNLLLYGHPMVVDALAAPGPLGPLDRDLLVEVAEASVLAAALGLKPEGLGVAGLMADPSPILVRSPRLPAPLWLASASRVPAAAVVGGASLLGGIPGRHRAVTALVHVDELAALSGFLGVVERVSVYWDLADAPTAALSNVGGQLADEGLADRWMGLHIYRHPRRPVADADDVERWWAGMAADDPGRLGAL